MPSKPFDEARAIAEQSLAARGWKLNAERGDWESPDGEQRGQLAFEMDFSYGMATDMVAKVKLRHPQGAERSFSPLLDFRIKRNVISEDSRPTPDLLVRTAYEDGRFLSHQLYASVRIGTYRTDGGLLRAIAKHAEGDRNANWDLDAVHRRLKAQFDPEIQEAVAWIRREILPTYSVAEFLADPGGLLAYQGAPYEDAILDAAIRDVRRTEGAL